MSDTQPILDLVPGPATGETDALIRALRDVEELCQRAPCISDRAILRDLIRRIKYKAQRAIEEATK